MIGIKTQNLIWEKALLNLLGPNAEKHQIDHTYDVIICQEKTSGNCLILGKDITLPFRFEALKEKLTQLQGPKFENNNFKWLPQTRQLIHKQSQKIIQLTEKESEIIGFLAGCPQHKASKDEILGAVWHYQNDIHTHTLESHIYALRQKLPTDQLFVAQEGGYKLIF